MIPRTREALSQLLLRTFPVSEDLDTATVDAFVDALMKVRADTRALEVAGPASLVKPGDSRLYAVRATHARRTPVTSVFIAETDAVLVRLPADEPHALETPIGDVLPEDHFLPTVSAVRARFGERIGRPFERVDLVTPARRSGVRFASMALYIGYEHEASTTPLFTVFEPGAATGAPKALYLAVPHDAVVEEPAGYTPTPFSAPDHVYTGGLKMAPNGRDPDVLFMQAAARQGEEPYLRLHAEYQLVDRIPFSLPARELVEAALRVLAVQKSLGFSPGLVDRLLGDVGLWAVPWVDRPDNVDPDSGVVSVPFVPCVAYDIFLSSLAEPDLRIFQASIAMLVAEVVKIDGKFDRLERIEADWILNFEIPAELGDPFCSSFAAKAEREALFDGAPPIDGRPFAARLAHLATVVERLPPRLSVQYKGVVARVCHAAAESSGTWLWFGTKVSAEEKGVLDQIAEALGLDEQVHSSRPRPPRG